MSSSGLDYNVNIGVETTYGVFASSLKAPPGDLLEFLPIFNEEEIAISPISSQNEFQGVDRGKALYGYDLEFVLRDFEFLAWCMGTEGTVTGTDPYTHPLSLASSLPSLSLEAIPVSGYGSSFVYTGGKVTSMTLKAVTGEKVIVSLKVLTKKPTIDGSPSSVETLNTSTSIKFSGLTITVDGNSYADAVESIELNVDRNCEQKYGLSSIDVQEIKEGRRSALITIDVRISDPTLLNLLINGTEFATTLIFQDTATHKGTFTFSKCEVFNVDQTVGENALKENLQIRVVGDWTAETIDSIADYLA